MKNNIALVLIIIIYNSFYIIGQSPINNKDFKHYEAAALLKKGSGEIKVFNSIYTEKVKYGFDKFLIRSTYQSTFIQTLYGITSKINIGFDAIHKSFIQNDLVKSSFLNVLKYKTSNSILINSVGDTIRHKDGWDIYSNSAHKLSHLGPKIKYQPFKKIPGLTAQLTFLFPLDKEFDNSFKYISDLFYNYRINKKQQLFIALSWWSDIKPKIKVDQYFKVFYSYFPSNRFTIYTTGTLPYRYGKDGGIDFFDLGLGTKYLITNNLELELLATHFILPGNNEKKANTYNLGIRYSFIK